MIGLSYFKLNKLKLSSELATSDCDEWKCISEQRKADMIELKNVCKRFKEHDALKDLNLKVESGEVYGLLGANGAGKSTTLNLILGFLQPDSGSIQVVHSTDGSSISTNQIGYIPENVQLYPYLSGIENVDYFTKLTGQSYTNSQLSEFLVKCGLQADAHGKNLSDYSKGMRQKVGIAIAYAKQAPVYLLDEPASGLDPVASNQLTEILKMLAADGGAVLMASHDIFRVRESCDRIGILKQGQLVHEILSEDVTSNELEQLYLNFMKD